MKMNTQASLCVLCFRTLAIFMKPSLLVKYKERVVFQSPAILHAKVEPWSPFINLNTASSVPWWDSVRHHLGSSVYYSQANLKKPIMSTSSTYPPTFLVIFPYCSVFSPISLCYFSFNKSLLWKKYLLQTT